MIGERPQLSNRYPASCRRPISLRLAEAGGKVIFCYRDQRALLYKWPRVHPGDFVSIGPPVPLLNKVFQFRSDRMNVKRRRPSQIPHGPQMMIYCRKMLAKPHYIEQLREQICGQTLLLQAYDFLLL